MHAYIFYACMWYIVRHVNVSVCMYMCMRTSLLSFYIYMNLYGCMSAYIYVICMHIYMYVAGIMYI